MKIRLASLLLVPVLCLTLFAGCAGAGDNRTLVLGLDAQFPPMGFVDENNNTVGFDIDVAKAVCDKLGMTLKLQTVKPDTEVDELRSGKIDCIWNGFAITDARKSQVLFAGPYITNRQVIVVKSSSAITDLSGMAGKTLALQTGSKAADALDAAVSFKASLGSVINIDDNVSGLLDLDSNGADAALMDEVAALYYIKKDALDLRILDVSLAKEEYGIGFRLSDGKLRDKVQGALEELANNGTLAEISTTWFGKDITTINQ